MKLPKTTAENDAILHFGNRLLRLPIAGGNWNNGSNAGVFYLNLNNPRSNSNSNIGFRSALPSLSDLQEVYGCPAGTEGIKESVSTPKRRKTTD
jgi:hypothetical protein